MELDLDKLKAVRVLGRGAMGTVFLVAPRCSPDRLHDSKLPPLFALKVFEKGSAAAKRPDADRRARWELTVLSRLSVASGGKPHPFLPSLVGFVETSDLLAWAVPFCPGGDLHRLRHSLSPDAAFSPAAIRFYVSELVSAIAHLHSLRIAYRDLKPENVLLQSSGHITLTDFDLSRHLPPRSSPSSSSSSPTNLHGPPPLLRPTLPPPHPADASHRHHRHRRNLTRIFAFGGGGGTASRSAVESHQHSNHNHLLHLKKARSARVSPVSRRKPSFSAFDAGSSSGGGCERSFSFVGTEEYVSPEVVRGEGHEFAVDWWALGILTYEMAYGRTPFRGRNRKETFRNVLTRAPEFVGRRRTDLTDLIERLLAKDPTRRLGYAGGAEEVKSHPFFQGVRWDLLADVTRPPFLAPLEDLEEEVMGPGGYGTAEGFDVSDYLKGLHQLQPAPPSTVTSSESLGEF